jgi:RNA polymerase sigma-70 factor (sigma-E family)
LRVEERLRVVNEAGAGDFEDFVAARTGALLRYAHVLTGDPYRAEDLVQSALASCYRHWRRIGAVDAERYVRRAVLNAYLSWWRRPLRRHETSVDDVTPLLDARRSALGADAGLDVRDELWRALGQLPPRQRAVLVLRYYEDLTEVQTAAALDVSVGTIKSQHAKAMRTLRGVFGPSAADKPELSGGVR